MINAIDISQWQLPSKIDYDELCDPANGIDAVILKVSEALSVDPEFANHWPEFLKRGMPVLGYHFFRSNYDGQAQAANALNRYAPVFDAQGGGAIFCDIETQDATSNPVRIHRAGDFLETITAASHRTGVYSSPSLWQQLMTPVPAWINDYDNWVAHWTAAASPQMPQGWLANKVVFWQYGIWNNYPWCPPVPGMLPDVDVDYGYFVDRQSVFEWMGVTAPPPPPAECGCEEELEALNMRITALESKSVVVDFRLDGIEDRLTVLEENQPGTPGFVGKPYTVTEEKTLGRWQTGTNAAGNPILEIYETPRYKWVQGETLYTDGNGAQQMDGYKAHLLQPGGPVGANSGAKVPASPQLWVRDQDISKGATGESWPLDKNQYTDWEGQE